MRIIRKILFLLILLISLLIVWINFKLYSDNFTKEEKKNDIVLQLNFLEDELKHNDLGRQMQGLFPEGFVFTNALYGLSWCELGISDSINKTRALNEALYAYDQINTEEAKIIFDNDVQPENGIYYTGWNNYLLSKILLLDTNFTNSKVYKKTFERQCELISASLKKSKSPFLQSYPDQCWPADMCVAMASLSNHDKIFKPKYKDLISEWVANVKLKVDPKTKLIPHKVNASDGATIEGARGCSISLILRFLAEIDYPFAKEQYKLYKEKFVTTTFGLPSIDEYPKGQSGSGDVDSGPVIFGVGFSGTIVSVGTLSVLGDAELAEQQYKTINAFGLSSKTANTKKYVFGQLPIADAFLAWSRISGLNTDEGQQRSSENWRIKFHLISVLVIGAFWLLFYAKAIYFKLRKEYSNERERN